jgi:VWFA-related protein
MRVELRRGLCVVAALCLTASSSHVSAQSPLPQSDRADGQRPVFRGGVELVQVDVSVLDRNRRPVTGLTASDFTVTVDGVRKPIRGFTAVQLPARDTAAASAAARDAVPPDVATNRVGSEDGRIVVILMDRSIGPEQPTLAARSIATAAVKALGPHDLAAVTSTSGGVPQNLTADRARLIAAITQRDWSTGISKEMEAIVGKQDPLSDGRCLCGLCVLDSVTRIADALQHAPRRHKMLLFIGSRLIFQSGPRAPTADTGCEYPLRRAVQRMQNSLALSHMTVHSIDPYGLSNVGGVTRAGTPGGKPGENRFAKIDQFTAEMMDLLGDQGSLRVLPELTGGRVVVNTNAPQDQVPDIFDESSAYYVLAFEPDAGRSGDDSLPIDVTVARRDVRVYTQRKYVPPNTARTDASGTDGASPPALDSALRGLVPDASRPLALAVAAFADGANERGTVVVNVDAGAFATGTETSRPLEFAVGIVDQTGRQIAGGREAATVAFSRGVGAATAEGNVQTTLQLAPGSYEVRVAVFDPATGVAASVFTQLTVPRFDNVPLSLSDLLVEAARVTAPPARPSSASFSATTRRVFDRREGVRALLQVYQGTGRTSPLVPVSVRARITTADGRVVRDQLMNLTEKDFTNRIAGMALDMSDLLAGEYVLAIDASGDNQKASRAVPFSMR